MAEQGKSYFLYFAAFSINFVAFSTGLCFSWTSPFLPKFRSNDVSVNPISRPITTSEAAWLVSIISLGLLIGPLIPSLITKKFGKKTTLLLSSLPLLAAHIICALANTIELFLIARFLMGLATGAAWTVIPGYIAEISEPKNRGFLSSSIMVMNTSGGLLAFCIGPFLSMTWFSVVSLVPVALFFILILFFIPESPYDLIKKNSLKRAEESLITLRQKIEVHAELAEIKKSIEADNVISNGKFVDLCKSASLIRAMIMGGGVMIVNSLCGVYAVVGYTETIFDLAGSSVPSAYSAIIVSSISVVAAIGHTFVVDRLGRKILMTISCSILFLSLSLLGTFFYLQQNNFNIVSLAWLPLCSLIFYMIGFYMGLGAVPYIIMGELFPSNIKAVAIGLCTSINFTIIFILTLGFPYLFDSVGMEYTFWLLAVFMALGVIFSITVVPETKGKSLQEITAMLNKDPKS